MSKLHETRDQHEWKYGLRASLSKKNCLFLLYKGAWSPLPSEQGSQPAAHTETQRPPAKPLANLYSSILSASQSQQGAAGGKELCWIEEVDRLHGSRRSWTELLLAHRGAEQREASAGATGWLQRQDVESFSLSVLLLCQPATQVRPIYCSTVLTPPPLSPFSFFWGFYCLTFLQTMP